MRRALRRTNVYIGKTKLTSTTDLFYTRAGRVPNTTYNFTVRAVDPFGNVSSPSKILEMTTRDRDATGVIGTSSIDGSSGVTISNNVVSDFDDGDWVKFSNVDFKTGVSSVKVTLGSATTSSRSTTTSSCTSMRPAGRRSNASVQGTGSQTTYLTQQTEVSGASGTHDLYLVARHHSTVANLQSLQFSTRSLTKVMMLGDSVTQEYARSTAGATTCGRHCNRPARASTSSVACAMKM